MEIIDTIQRKTKTGKSLVLQWGKQEGYEQMDAFIKEGETLKKVGDTTFRFHEGRCWLNLIHITDEAYHLQGIGGEMLKYLEYLCAQRGIRNVEGKFYPEGRGAEHARRFYESRGYTIDKDGYETYVSKYLDVQNIKQQFEKTDIENEKNN